jgi:protein-S-isoprenylcysteine O-methyltransferase Ste14
MIKNNMNTSIRKSKLLNLAWVPYIIILFEMLYMATPFAAFFYSVYQFPLKFLNENPVTARLIQTILPHFIETNSNFLHLLSNAGWIMMAIGSIVFIIGFVQIYYTKFTNKTAVTGGIYNLIRHPQYAAWILFGFGMSLVWSRLIVWIMFVTMIFIYYFLARAEERECREKYPETYPYYLKKTGMFFPKIFNFGEIHISFLENKFLHAATIILIYACVVGITVFLAFSLRSYTISKMSTVYGKDYMAVSVSYISPEITKKTIDILLEDRTVQQELSKLFKTGDAKIFYVMPQPWILPELGMATELIDHTNPQPSSSSHGNPLDTTPSKKRVLLSLAKLIQKTEPSGILYYLKQQIPKLYVDIDIDKGKVISISKPPKEGIYSNLPVPVF